MEYNFKIEEKNSNVLVLTANEGTKLTYWTEGEDIKNYNSFTIAYVGKSFDLNRIQVLTLEKDAEYSTQQETALQKEFEEQMLLQEKEQLK